MSFLSQFILTFTAILSLSFSLKPPRPALYQQRDDFVLVDYHNVSLSFSNFSYKGLVSTTNRSYTAYVAVLPFGIPDMFSIELPQKGCGSVDAVTNTSKLYNCTYSTNAGFFDTRTGSCVGNIITNGQHQQIAGSNRVNFGVTRKSYVIGYLTNHTLIGGEYNWTQLISGAGWLVRRGSNNVNTSKTEEGLDDTFVNEKAPRTGICAAKNGTLIIVQVDGEEDSKEGLDLYEFAEVMKELGCWEAANLDGGGSSTSVYRGNLINQPTCNDSSDICQRHVSSVTCLRLKTVSNKWMVS